MKFGNINNKKIELFVDNGIDKYRRTEEVKVDEMIKIYLDNNGFFVLCDKELKFKGYLDLADLDIIKNLIEKTNNYKNKTIQDLISNKELKFREETIDANTSLIKVLEKLDSSNQNYFPVIKEKILLGRVSKKILKEKINALYQGS